MMAVVASVRRIVTGILVVAGSVGIASAPAHAIDNDKLTTCMHALRALYDAEKKSNLEGAGTRTLQQFGGIVNSDSSFNEANAKARFAQCGIPASQYKTQIALLQGECKLKPAIAAGKGDPYWDKLVVCMLQTYDSAS
ncbi:hypothetical protein [Nocardia pseudobrasiliensis]|nr:hypothetical protein [Nocardia pseudobrasiliensis]